jgi:sarcosine oxidase
MDAQLAVIGLGSIGSMALWQASRLSDSVVGFEAATPAHGRSAVGGDTRLFRMIYLGRPEYYPIIARSRGLWAELEAETGQERLRLARGEPHPVLARLDSLVRRALSFRPREFGAARPCDG